MNANACRRLPSRRCAGGFSLIEMIAIVAILGVVAALVVVRTGGGIDEADTAACHTQRGMIELQVQLWRRNFGVFPQANLSDIAANPVYLPNGLPTCPVDGTPYTIDTATGRINSHDH